MTGSKKRFAVILSVSCVLAGVLGVAYGSSGDLAMTNAPEAQPLPAGHVALSTYHLAALDTAACTRAATGGTVDVLPHAEGGFMFEVDADVDPVDPHNACRAQHLDHIELAYIDQSGNPVGEAFYDAVAALEECYPELRERVGQAAEEVDEELDRLLQSEERASSLCTPPQ